MGHLGLHFDNVWNRNQGPLVQELKQNNSKYDI